MSYDNELQAARASIAALEEANAELRKENALAKKEVSTKALSLSPTTTTKPRASSVSNDLFFKRTIVGNLPEAKHEALLEQLYLEVGPGDSNNSEGYFRFTTKNLEVTIESQEGNEKLTVVEKPVSGLSFLLVSAIGMLFSVTYLMDGGLTGWLGSLGFGLGSVACFLARPTHKKQLKRFPEKSKRLLAAATEFIEEDKS